MVFLPLLAPICRVAQGATGWLGAGQSDGQGHRLMTQLCSRDRKRGLGIIPGGGGLLLKSLRPPELTPSKPFVEIVWDCALDRPYARQDDRVDSPTIFQQTMHCDRPCARTTECTAPQYFNNTFRPALINVRWPARCSKYRLVAHSV